MAGDTQLKNLKEQKTRLESFLASIQSDIDAANADYVAPLPALPTKEEINRRLGRAAAEDARDNTTSKETAEQAAIDAEILAHNNAKAARTTAYDTLQKALSDFSQRDAVANELAKAYDERRRQIASGLLNAAQQQYATAIDTLAAAVVQLGAVHQHIHGAGGYVADVSRNFEVPHLGAVGAVPEGLVRHLNVLKLSTEQASGAVYVAARDLEAAWLA